MTLETIPGVDQSNYIATPVKANPTLITALALTILGALITIASPLVGLVITSVAIGLVVLGGILLAAGIGLNFFVSFKKPEPNGEWLENGTAVRFALELGAPQDISAKIKEGIVTLRIDGNEHVFSQIPHYKHTVIEQGSFIFKKENAEDWLKQFTKVHVEQENAGNTTKLTLHFDK